METESNHFKPDEAENNFFAFLTLPPEENPKGYAMKQIAPTDPNQDEIRIQFMLRNPPSYAIVSNFGATLVSLVLPDRNGQLEDCVLGFDT